MMLVKGLSLAVHVVVWCALVGNGVDAKKSRWNPLEHLGGIEANHKTTTTMGTKQQQSHGTTTVSTNSKEEFQALDLDTNNKCGCPTGTYLTPEQRQHRTDLLRIWCAWLQATQGFVSANNNANANLKKGGPQRRPERMAYQPDSHWWHYEHPQWPKPAHCYQPGVLHVGERDENTYCGKPIYSVYMTNVEPLQMQFYHPSKTGSSTIISYLKRWKGHPYYCSNKGFPKIKGKNTTVYMSIREPISRFISGYGEILQRECSMDVWQSKETQDICWNNHGLDIRGKDGTAFAECLLRESECAPGYCHSEHLFSHAFFVTRDRLSADGPSVTHLVPNDELTTQLPSLVGGLLDNYRQRLQEEEAKEKEKEEKNKDKDDKKKKKKKKPPPLPFSGANQTLPAVRFENQGGQKDEQVLAQVDQMKALLNTTTTTSTNNGRLLEIICRMYMQDYVCLFQDQDLPDVCRAMLEEAKAWYDLQTV